jgi:hypothetical protein
MHTTLNKPNAELCDEDEVERCLLLGHDDAGWIVSIPSQEASLEGEGICMPHSKQVLPC